MNTPYHFYHLFLLFSLISLPCIANDRIILNLSQDYGGEALAIDSNNQIQLGAGLTSTLGISSAIENTNIAYAFSLGYKINSARFPGGAVLFTTYPLNALIYYTNINLEIGIGLSRHINPVLRYNCNPQSQCGVSRAISFNDSIGVVLDFNYAMSAKSMFGVRYTSMKYTGIEIEDIKTNKVRDTLDVSHISIQLGYEF